MDLFSWQTHTKGLYAMLLFTRISFILYQIKINMKYKSVEKLVGCVGRIFASLEVYLK